MGNQLHMQLEGHAVHRALTFCNVGALSIEDYASGFVISF